MTDVSDLIQRVLHPLRDAAQNFFTDDEMIDYFNNAIIDLCARQRLIRSQVSVPIATGGVIALTPDVLQTRWVKNPDGVEVNWLDESTFFEYQLIFPAGDVASPFGTIYNDVIYVYPSVDGEEWVVGYYAIPTRLEAPSDAFPLRRLWEEKVVRYCRSECWYKLGEVAMGDRERSYYEEGLRPSEAMTDHQVPGRVNLAREPNVFDTHPESIHQGG